MVVMMVGGDGWCCLWNVDAMAVTVMAVVETSVVMAHAAAVIPPRVVG